MSTIYREFQKTVAKHPKTAAIQWIEKGRVKSWDYSALDEKVRAFAAGLRSLGYQKGDRIALISTNHPHWAIVDLALAREGMILVPMHTTLSQAQLQMILKKAHAGALVLGKGFEEGAEALVNQAPANVKHVIFFEEPKFKPTNKNAAVLHTVGQIISQGEALQSRKGELPEVSVSGEDSSVIIYTSGTTGEMKGVELTQENLVQNAYGADAYVQCPEGEVVFSVLPLSHAFERVAGFLIPMFLGLTVAFGRGLDFLLEDMQIIRPRRMDAVPRLLEKLFEGIQNKLYQKSPILQGVFNFGAKISGYHRQLSRDHLLLSPLLWAPHQVFDGLFFRKVRSQFGGRLKRLVVGGALLDNRVAEFFDALGFEILEGYGLTECSPVVTANQAGHPHIGSVGKAIPGVEVKIGPHEEILVRGHNVMKGYFEDPVRTAEVIDKQGWFHTGDQGRLDQAGFLYIKGRVKELIVTSNGKNIVPNQVEQAMEASPFISQSMVYGHGKPFLVALVVPCRERVETLIRKQMSENNSSWGELCEGDAMHELLAEEIRKGTQDLARHEQVKKFAVVPEEFSQAEDLLTPTLKLKRKKICERYQKDLKSLY